jgi:hypothetical protein
MIAKVSTILFVLLNFYSFLTIAQTNKPIKGQIISYNKQPLSFCHIVIKREIKDGTISNYDGFFSINAKVGDTLLVSYIGYENAYFEIKDTSHLNLSIKPSLYNLNELVVKPKEINKLSAKEVIKKATKYYYINHINTKENYKFYINSEIKISENNKDIFKYSGKQLLYKQKGKRLLGDKKDTILRRQNSKIDSNVFIVNSSKPYEAINWLMLKRPNVNDKLITYEYGEINHFNGKEIYQIKFHRKLGKGVCQTGGFYFISKEGYRIVYYEGIVNNCESYTYDNMDEFGNLINTKVMIDYVKVNVELKEKIDTKYAPHKIESITKHSLYQNDKLIKKFKKKSTINVLKIDHYNKTDNLNLIPAKDIFYNFK